MSANIPDRESERVGEKRMRWISQRRNELSGPNSDRIPVTSQSDAHIMLTEIEKQDAEIFDLNRRLHDEENARKLAEKKLERYTDKPSDKEEV